MSFYRSAYFLIQFFFGTTNFYKTSKMLEKSYKVEVIIQLFHEMQDNLFLEEKHLYELSTIESNKRLRLGDEEPKYFLIQ